MLWEQSAEGFCVSIEQRAGRCTHLSGKVLRNSRSSVYTYSWERSGRPECPRGLGPSSDSQRNTLARTETSCHAHVVVSGFFFPANLKRAFSPCLIF